MSQPDSLNVNPFRVLKEAIKQVPALKYALGVASDFRLQWSFEGTKHFISKSQQLAANGPEKTGVVGSIPSLATNTSTT